jgi:hypothetical protein
MITVEVNLHGNLHVCLSVMRTSCLLKSEQTSWNASPRGL